MWEPWLKGNEQAGGFVTKTVKKDVETTPTYTEKPIFARAKFVVGLAGILAVIVVLLVGAFWHLSQEQEQQAIGAIKWIVLTVLGGHAATDIASLFTPFVGHGPEDEQ